MYRNLIKARLLDYLDKKEISYKKCGKVIMVDCPICHGIQCSQVIPNTNIVNCFPCEKQYDIIDYARTLDNLKDKSEEEVLHFLKRLLDINVSTEIDKKNLDKLFAKYKQLGFDMVPVMKNSKIPFEKEWQLKEHKDPLEWLEWYNNGDNLGIKTGKLSNVTVLDIDTKEISKEIITLLGEAIIQRSSKGWHYFYTYEEQIPKTRIDELKIDIENRGGQVVCSPSIVEGKERTWINIDNFDSVPKMSKELKDFILSKITIPRRTISEELAEDIKTESFNLGVLNEGNRSNGLCLAGITSIRTPNKSKILRDLKIGDEVFSYNFKTKDIEISKIINMINVKSHNQLILTIAGRWGKEKSSDVKCTPEHPFYTKRGWIQAKDLKIKEEIFEIDYHSRTLLYDRIFDKTHLFYKIGYIYGYCIGDGHKRKDTGAWWISSIDKDGLYRIQQYILQIYNFECRLKYLKKKKLYDLWIPEHIVKKFEQKIKFNKKDFKKGFLSGIFDAEGNIAYDELRIFNTNKKIIQHIKESFKSIGFKYTIGVDTHRPKLCYVVKIGTHKQIIDFFRIIKPGILRKYPSWQDYSNYLLKNGRAVLKKVYKYSSDKKYNFYNIEVEPNNNFFARGLLTHNCKIGGIVRKEFGIHDTSRIIDIINKHLCNPPLEQKEISAMIGSFDKYIKYDNTELIHKILEFLKKVEKATQAEIELAITGSFTKGELKTRVKEALLYLEKEDYIIKKGREFVLIKKMEWDDTFMGVGKPLGFKVPYFEEIGHFYKGDLVIIGSKNKHGKTVNGINILQRLIAQGIKPYYIYSETGGRWGKYAQQLGLKEGTFYRSFCSDPEKMLLEPNAVTIYDWLMPNDFAQTDKIFNRVIEQLEKTQGFLICFVQLKEDNSFFACVDKKTEILTQVGWKKYNELNTNDIVANFNPETEEIFYSRLKAINSYNYNGELITLENKYLSQYITPNHKVLLKYKHGIGKKLSYWWDKEWISTEAKDITVHRGIKMPLAGYYNGYLSLRLEFAELIGWILTEGTIDKRYSNYIRLSQSIKQNPKKVKRIEELLTKLDIDFTKKIGKGIKKTCATFYIKANQHNKAGFYREIWNWIDVNKKPSWNLLHLKFKELKALFRGLIEGDGTTNSKRSWVFYQKDKKVIEWFQTLCCHLGYRTFIHETLSINPTHPEKEKCLMYNVRVLDQNWKNIEHGTNGETINKTIKKESYTDSVWCPTTESGYWVARREDKIFITGNSNMISQFPSLVTKYVHTDTTGVNTKFEIVYNRDPKFNERSYEIPCVYNWETKEIKTAYEIEQENRKQETVKEEPSENEEGGLEI